MFNLVIFWICCLKIYIEIKLSENDSNGLGTDTPKIERYPFVLI